MEFHNTIYALSEKVERNRKHCTTEEATKTSLILPFFTALGYDTTDPLEVMPEAPCAIKGFDRIDYILAHGGEYRMLVECKHWNENLNKHVKQLEQYFQAGLKPYCTRIGVLTNGIEYRFFADTDRDNIMDDEPFFVFDISHADNDAIERLKMFRRDDFDAEKIIDTARKLKTSAKLHRLVEDELRNPSEELVNLFWYKMGTGKKLSRQQREIFTPLLKAEIYDYTMSRINQALDTQMRIKETCNDETASQSNEAVTILSVFHDILKDIVDTDRVSIEKTYDYYAIRLDNSQWLPICKVRLNPRSKFIWVGRYWPPSKKFYASWNHREPIKDAEDIRLYAKDIIDVVKIMLMTNDEGRENFVNVNRPDWLVDTDNEQTD